MTGALQSISALFELALEVQAVENRLLLAVAKNNGEQEAECRAILHALLDRKLDLQCLHLQNTIRELRR